MFASFFRAIVLIEITCFIYRKSFEIGNLERIICFFFIQIEGHLVGQVTNNGNGKLKVALTLHMGKIANLRGHILLLRSIGY